MKRPALFAAVAVLLAACTQYTLVPAQPRVTVADTYSVEPQVAWSKATEGKHELWTVDGPLLDQVRFIKALEDGDTLTPPEGEKKLPPFDHKMTALEIKDFVVTSIAAADNLHLTSEDLRPFKFGTADGFRFEFTTTRKDGLDMAGFVVGAVIKERLHLIIYYGTRLYYFDKHKDEVERLVQSIRLL